MNNQYFSSHLLKLTAQEEQIYCRILQRHRRQNTEKFNFTKRLNSHIFQSNNRPKSRFYAQNRETMFKNTLKNGSIVDENMLTLSELEIIPANQFFQLCLKLDNLNIKEQDKRQNIEHSLKDIISNNKSTDHIRINQHDENTLKYRSLQKDMENLIQKLPTETYITNLQFFQLFMKKKKEARKISIIKKQIELQIEQQSYSRRKNQKNE